MLLPAAHAQKAPAETDTVKKTVTAFLDGLRRGDSLAVRRRLAPAAVFHDFGGQPGQPPSRTFG
ncbi:MAG: hypothetical protein M3Y12_07340 [Bacteroidota bacterium]|nr:hypothetical protein [Bacteroidota bacterium]